MQEYDEEINADGLGELNEKEKESIDKELNKNLLPNLRDVKVDDQTGSITIDSANIDSFDIKYYLIDAEILFSRSPFV